jgi:hypothetical protein
VPVLSCVGLWGGVAAGGACCCSQSCTIPHLPACMLLCFYMPVCLRVCLCCAAGNVGLWGGLAAGGLATIALLQIVGDLLGEPCLRFVCVLMRAVPRCA